MNTTVDRERFIVTEGSCTVQSAGYDKEARDIQSFKMNTFNILSPGPIALSSTLPRLTAVMKIPGSPGTQGLSRPPLIFNPSLPSRPDNKTCQI